MSEVEKLQKLIDESNNIVFFGGAGVSTDSGIKDFRGKDGLYKEKQLVNRTPEYMLSIKCLTNEPDLFFEYYRTKMNCLDKLPNVTHKYLTKLEETGKLKAIVTQNIDGLHQKANSKKVYELHGTTLTCSCMKCGKTYNGEELFKQEPIPKCECGGTLRPDIVLYGEMLPDCFNTAAYLISEADLLIVAGTSLTVEPAASLVRLYRGKHLVIINQDETPYDRIAELVIHTPMGEIFSNLK